MSGPPTASRTPTSSILGAEVYRGAAHGFTMTDSAAFDEAATERHWTALLGLLSRTLPAE